MALYVLYTTVNSEENAKKIAHALIDNRFAACVSFFPAASVYRWEGKTCEDAEFVLMIKTISPSDVMKFLKENHPYKLPEIIFFQVDASDEYLGWVKESQAKR